MSQTLDIKLVHRLLFGDHHDVTDEQEGTSPLAKEILDDLVEAGLAEWDFTHNGPWWTTPSAYLAETSTRDVARIRLLAGEVPTTGPQLAALVKACRAALRLKKEVDPG